MPYSEVELGIGDLVTLSTYIGEVLHVFPASFAITTSMNLDYPPNLDCNTPVSYQLNNFAAAFGGSASWIIKQNGITKASGTGATASTSNVSNGGVDLEFTVSFPGVSGLEPLSFSEEYAFGILNNTVVTGQAAVCPSSLYIYTANVPGGHGSGYSYSWSYPNNWTNYGQNANRITLYTPSSPDYGTVRVSVTNSCGTGNYSGITVYPGYCGGYYMVSPNPVSDYVTINITEDRNRVTELYTPKYIIAYIYDKMGTMVYSNEFGSLPFEINTSKLSKGNYLLKIITQPANSEEEMFIESIQLVKER